MMKRFGKAVLGALAISAVTASQASASCFLFIFCSPGGGGGTPHAPEIDVTQGAAALAILACAVLVLRERFVRVGK